MDDERSRHPSPKTENNRSGRTMLRTDVKKSTVEKSKINEKRSARPIPNSKGAGSICARLCTSKEKSR